MRRIQEKETAIKFLIDRIKKHMVEAYNSLENTSPAKNCVDISIYLTKKVEEEMNDYISLLSNRMQHYSNVASMLAERMSKFSQEISDLDGGDVSS